MVTIWYSASSFDSISDGAPVSKSRPLVDFGKAITSFKLFV